MTKPMTHTLLVQGLVTACSELCSPNACIFWPVLMPMLASSAADGSITGYERGRRSGQAHGQLKTTNGALGMNESEPHRSRCRSRRCRSRPILRSHRCRCRCRRR
eukprot:6637386-Prymnesium_polylepis.1